MELRGHCPAASLTQDMELPGLVFVDHLPSYLQGSRAEEVAPVVLGTDVQLQLGPWTRRLS